MSEIVFQASGLPSVQASRKELTRSAVVPQMSTGDIESCHALRRLKDNIQGTPYSRQSLIRLPSNQQEHYPSISSETHPESSPYYSPIQSPYSAEQSSYGREFHDLETSYDLCDVTIHGGSISHGNRETVVMNTEGTTKSQSLWAVQRGMEPMAHPFTRAFRSSDLPLQRSTRSGNSLVTSTNITSRSTATVKAGLDTQRQTVTKVGKAPRKRKSSSDKQEKPKVPKLTMPLSELTKDYHHLPVRDMDTWVQRPPEMRWAEVEKRGGYVTRPMNSFMLYRSAYAERTKLWCLQNNHQVVSSVSGESWPLEPPDIREKYNELAKIERVNHQTAHPGYKFSPSKSQSGRKRKGVKREQDSESISDIDVLDGLDQGSAESRMINRKSTKTPLSESRTSLGYLGISLDSTDGGAHRSSFTHSNPGKTPPVCMGAATLNGQYYQTTVRANSVTPMPNIIPSTVIEDVTIRKTQVPGHGLNAQHPNSTAGRGMHTPEILHGQRRFPIHDDSLQVDPALLKNEANEDGYDDYQYPEASHRFEETDLDVGNFAIDPVFTGSSDLCLLTQGYQDDPASLESTTQFGGGEIDTSIDIQKLPGYDISMQDFLNTEEPWAVTEGLNPDDEDQLCYDEWLQ